MIRTVSWVEDPDTVVPWARFELVGDEAIASYYDDDFRDLIAGWRITPAHGREFLDELDRVFRASSRVLIGTE